MPERRDSRGAVPRTWERLFGWLMPAGQRDAGLGDAEEEFRRRVSRDGEAEARRWYRRQVVRSVPAAVGRGVVALNAAWRNERKADRMSAWIRDFRMAFRALRRRPGFSATVLVTLALGVGATTALFGVYRTVFLEPIPLPASDRLMVVMGEGSAGCCGPASGPDYIDWAERNSSFEALALLNPGNYTLTGMAEPERIAGTVVTANVFPMLGVEPVLGRTLLAEDEQAEGAIVVSWRFWQNQLGGRRDVVDTSIELDGTTYTIVGVMPEGFDVPSPWGGQYGTFRVYLPFQRTRIARANRGSYSWPVIGRLRPGATKESAQIDMERITRQLGEEYPQTNADWNARVFTLHEYLYGQVGGQLRMILGAAAVVLLIACGNVAGLLLARAATRETEMSVRAALGASRRAMVRLLFSEALLLALAGGVLGMLISYAAIDGFRALLPPTIPRVSEIRVDGPALAFALAASAVTALVFGIVPALLASRVNLASNVKEGGYATLAPAKERLSNAFIVGQIALGLVLANGAVLLVRSYSALRGQDFGFAADGVITMSLNPAGPRYTDDAAYQTYYDDVLERVGAIAGVSSAGTISRLPLYGGTNSTAWVEGTPPRRNDGEGPLVEVTSVNGDYFEAMGIALLRGRLLQPADSNQAATGVVINERFAGIGWPDQDPIGKRFSFDDDPPNWLTVVGVVTDVRQWGPELPAQAQVYLPFARGWSTGSYLTVRTAGDPTALVTAIRSAVIAADPTQPPSDVRMMAERVDRRFAQRRFYTTLIALFAAAALFLAAAGVYGTMSYFVARRIREMGIRMALGAGATGILGLVVRRGLRLALFGVLIGLAGVWASTRVIEELVYGMQAIDPLTIVIGCVAMATVAIAASVIPASRAIRISPVLALRSE